MAKFPLDPPTLWKGVYTEDAWKGRMTIRQKIDDNIPSMSHNIAEWRDYVLQVIQYKEGSIRRLVATSGYVCYLSTDLEGPYATLSFVDNDELVNFTFDYRNNKLYFGKLAEVAIK